MNVRNAAIKQHHGKNHGFVMKNVIAVITKEEICAVIKIANVRTVVKTNNGNNNSDS